MFLETALSTSVFFNLGSANLLLGSLKMLKIVLYGTFKFPQVIRNLQEVPRIEKGWKTLVYITYCTTYVTTTTLKDKELGRTLTTFHGKRDDI